MQFSQKKRSVKVGTSGTYPTFREQTVFALLVLVLINLQEVVDLSAEKQIKIIVKKLLLFPSCIRWMSQRTPPGGRVYSI